jgi:hypothetical protein
MSTSDSSSSSVETIYRCTPRQVRGFITEVLYAGLVPFVRSSPGIGKSSIMRAIAKELNLHMIDHRLSTSDPTDLSGLPNFDNKGMAYFAPFTELFPIASTPMPHGKDGWMVFFDEANSAKLDVQAASYKFILDRMVGQHKIHENVVVSMAGNLDTDRAITNRISTAMQSRVIHLEMEVNFNEWLEDVALKEGYDGRIIAYQSYKKGTVLMDFRPDHNEKTFCCPRTWAFMNRLISGKDVTEERVPLYAGTITSGVAVDFVQFCKVYKTLVTVKQILADPESCQVPDDLASKWAVIGHMMEHVDEKSLENLALYANRFPTDFRILFWRSIMVRHPRMRQHSAFSKAMIELSRYLNS